MSQTPAARSFTLSPRPPIRAFAVTAVVDVVGLLVLIAGQWLDQTAVVISGVVILVLGTSLLATSLLLNSRLRSLITLDDRGITIQRAKQTRTVAWADVTGAHLTPTHLVIDAVDGKGAEVVNPRGNTDPLVTDLATEVARRLDADRGYTPFS